MKTFRLFFLMPFFLINVTLSAQQGGELKAEAPLLSEQITPSNEPAKFDLTAGQQESYFEDLPTYIARNLTYPDLAQRHSIEGQVRILVEISASGKISSKEVVHSLGYGCDESALALIDNMPDWTPAFNYGLPVKSKKILELNFRLQ